MPEVTVTELVAPTINDGPFTERMRKVAAGALGAASVEEAVPVMGAEDVGLFSLDGKIPLSVFWLGAADPQKLAAAKAAGTSLPNIHSSLFAPAYEPTIRTGVTAFTAMALSLLPR
jgi:hippurate hydrolase